MLFVPILIAVPKLHPGVAESRFGVGTPEKNAKAEPKADVGPRSRSSSSTPTSPKPPLQSPKPSLAARPTIPQKPRTASRPGKGSAGQGVTPGSGGFRGSLDCDSTHSSGAANDHGHRGLQEGSEKPASSFNRDKG